MTLVGRILDLLLPTACAFCSSPLLDPPAPFICSGCWTDFSAMSGPLCPRCGIPFESPETLSFSPDHCCIACRREPPAFDQALSIGYFEGPLREAIHQLKYRPCRSLGAFLGGWMAGNLAELGTVDVVMPIPLHTSRLHYRGFNQALLLAAPIARRFSVPLSYANLYRVRPTRPQVELSGMDRVRNVAGAFGLMRPELAENSTILLIDDVFTTGATMSECARVLKQAGAVRVNALTLARVV